MLKWGKNHMKILKLSIVNCVELNSILCVYVCTKSIVILINISHYRENESNMVNYSSIYSFNVNRLETQSQQKK